TRSLDLKQGDLLRLAKLLEDAKAASDTLKKSLSERELELAASKEGRLKLDDLLKLRQEALADAGKKITLLENERVVLRTAAENRFAGIELSGKRVVFLIDTSGSMVMLDSKTDAPHKWKEVRLTAERLMKSMPGLEKYQVVTFAGRASYPLGKAGEWLDYDRKDSPARVAKALEAIKPDGGTNMHAALEQAFAFRKRGLDAVYLLSDGLPNLGEGLTERERRELPEVEKGVKLGRFVRKKLDDEWNAAKEGQPKVQIHTIGFFYESPDLGSFLWALARENKGNFVGMSSP
ncbi:MAG: VWA domain-containing protein, partial [Gemmataceae bacterium]|nr:VWA domain-containing protein [Gemmataceae bacterium]